MVVISSTSSLLEMYESGRVDNKKAIIIAVQESKISDVDATKDDQPIPDTGDQSETDAYEGFLDVRFMPQVVLPTVPLSVVFPESYFFGGDSSRN